MRRGRRVLPSLRARHNSGRQTERREGRAAGRASELGGERNAAVHFRVTKVPEKRRRNPFRGGFIARSGEAAAERSIDR